nr:extracellular calcium-sensing receptor-like [Podarcis muralis]
MGIILLLVINTVYEKEIGAKVWITTALLEIGTGYYIPPNDFQYLHGSLSFAIQTGIRSSKGDNYKSPSNLVDSLDEAFQCSYSKHLLSVKGRKRCKEEEKLEPLSQWEPERVLFLDSYGTYINVHAVAQALHVSLSSRSQRRLMVEEGEQWGPQRLQPWQLHPFLREIQCLNTSRGRLCLDENWELPGDFDIINWVMSPNKSRDLVKIGNIRRETSASIKFTINPEAIEWPKKFN